MEEFAKDLAILGLKLTNVIAGAGASFVATLMWAGLRSVREYAAIFLGGWLIAAWGAPALRDWLEMRETTEIGLVILLGLFGMACTAEMWQLIRDMQWTRLGAALIEVARRMLGLRNGNGGAK